MNYLREEMDKSGAAQEAMRWGYPRPIEGDEVESAIWIRYGSGVLAWYLSGPLAESVTVHCCARPDRRGKLGSPREMVALELVAELMGAKRLYSITGLPGQDERIPRKAMRRFLRMRGWTQTEFGNYKELGE